MRNLIYNLVVMASFFNFHQNSFSQEHLQPLDRLPAVSGKFYPSDPDSLRQMLKELFKQAKPRSFNNVLAVINPHAGYIFSGQVAASGFNQADPDKQYENVFVIASSHHITFDGASVYNAGDYLTPLGKVKVNKELADELIKTSEVFTFRSDADKAEHSVEVQIPLLQYHLKKSFKLVPIVIGTQSKETCRLIAEALRPYFNERNLFIFSTDFSHYPTYSDAVATDKITCDAILSGSYKELLATIHGFKDKNVPNLATNLCGWTSVLVLQYLTEATKSLKYNAVQYMNSGDSKYGDYKQVVGYWSIVVTETAETLIFSARDKISLLKLARSAIENYLETKQIPSDQPVDTPASLLVKCGAFVTLKLNNELRGCIGRFSSDIPVYQLIREMAVAAAFRDNRFDQVNIEELAKLSIEISLLTPLKKISSTAEIKLGKHGIYIKKGYATGTLLPQVANEYGWNVEEFLGYCSKDKAGIGWNGWNDAEIYTYEAIIFSEMDFIGHIN